MIKIILKHPIYLIKRFFLYLLKTLNKNMNVFYEIIYNNFVLKISFKFNLKINKYF